MSSSGLTKPRAKKWAQVRFTMAGAKYGFLLEVTHSAMDGRYGPLSASFGSLLSKNRALAVPTVFLAFVGSGMAIWAPERMAGALSFLFFFISLSESISLTMAVPPFPFLSAPSRSMRVWPKKAAMPQKSLGFHLLVNGWTWHSAHWIWMPMNRLPVAPTSLLAAGWLLSWLASVKKTAGLSASLPSAVIIAFTILSHGSPLLNCSASQCSNLSVLRFLLL